MTGPFHMIQRPVSTRHLKRMLNRYGFFDSLNSASNRPQSTISGHMNLPNIIPDIMRTRVSTSSSKISQVIYPRPPTTFYAGLTLNINGICPSCRESQIKKVHPVYEEKNEQNNGIVIINHDGTIDNDEEFDIDNALDLDNDIIKSRTNEMSTQNSPRDIMTPPEVSAVPKNEEDVHRLVIVTPTPPEETLGITNILNLCIPG